MRHFKSGAQGSFCVIPSCIAGAEMLLRWKEEITMRRRGAYCLILLLTGWFAAGEASRGIGQVSETASLTESPRIFLDYAALMRKELALYDATLTTPTRTPKLQLFRMPSGFLAAPLGLVSEDDPPPEDPFAKVDDDDLAFLQITLGNHVPYLDLYKRGDPGGFGYYKIHSQMQIFDLGPTNVSLAVQAITPRGLQCGGVANGPTTLAPALACFHDLGEGAAVHAFVGQQVAANSRWREQFHTGLRCGLAMQHPVPFVSFNADQGLFVFVQALGQYRTDSYRADVRTTTWDVIPGVQYRLNSTCWMSMGLSRSRFMSCVWQY
jgi:hypothetical protein